MKRESVSVPKRRPLLQSFLRAYLGRGSRPGILLAAVSAGYALILLTVTLVNAAGADRWWYGSLNLYMPQWPWALPCVVIAPWYLMSAWRWSWVPVLFLAWVFGPIMGFSTGTAHLVPRPAGTHLRVMTYNVKWGQRDAEAVVANVLSANADVVLMQDSGGALAGRLSALNSLGWNDVRLGQYTVISRLPLSQLSQRWLTLQHDQEFLRCVLRVGSKEVVLYDVHLATPRWALGTVADYGADGAKDLQQNAAVRALEAIMVADQLKTETEPVIVTGDLNAPVQSRVCQTLFNAGLRDAFSEAGWGYGYTYGQSTALERPFVRIDHILASPQWHFIDCRAGGARGSDHSPVIADLLLPN